MYNEKLSVELVMREAIKNTGLSEWGDEGFLTPLNILMTSFEEDCIHSNLDAEKFSKLLVNLLTNRLLFQNCIVNNPEILKVAIKRPLFIVGLARSGTTILHNLMSQNRLCRTLKYWELVRPFPPPDISNWEKDPRVGLAEGEIESRFQKSPEMRIIHNINPKGPEECWRILINSLMHSGYFNKWYVRTYSEWLEKQDKIPVYEYYRKYLQMLLWKFPGDYLVLKCPSHLNNINSILKVFPDANIVWIHRNPLDVIPSDCSLRCRDHGVISLDKCRRMVWQIAKKVYLGMDMRDKMDSSRFFDVKFPDLIKDPITIIKNIHEYFNYECDPNMENALKAYLEENPRYKFGMHKYSLEQFGLDAEEIKQKFTIYCERFQIAFE